MELSVSLALLMIGATQNVSPPPPQPKDAATVGAGISKEQLAAAQSLNNVLAVAEHAQRAGDSVAAIRQYQKAGDIARSEKLLAEHQDRVLDKLGRAYLDGGRACDAVATYAALLEIRHNDCRPESDKI